MLATENIMTSLRTSDGLDIQRLYSMFNVDLLSTKEKILMTLKSRGFIEPYHHGIVRLTDRGKLVCDAIATRLLPDEHETSARV